MKNVNTSEGIEVQILLVQALSSIQHFALKATGVWSSAMGVPLHYLLPQPCCVLHGPKLPTSHSVLLCKISKCGLLVFSGTTSNAVPHCHSSLAHGVNSYPHTSWSHKGYFCMWKALFSQLRREILHGNGRS